MRLAVIHEGEVRRGLKLVDDIGRDMNVKAAAILTRRMRSRFGSFSSKHHIRIIINQSYIRPSLVEQPHTLLSALETPGEGSPVTRCTALSPAARLAATPSSKHSPL